MQEGDPGFLEGLPEQPAVLASGRSFRPGDAPRDEHALEHFSGLLDCSRAARDAAEFEARLATPGFPGAKAVRYCGEIRTIIGECEGKSITAAGVWPFLRVLHVLSLDLNSEPGRRKR